jgi:hypothetical protein
MMGISTAFAITVCEKAPVRRLIGENWNPKGVSAAWRKILAWTKLWMKARNGVIPDTHRDL